MLKKIDTILYRIPEAVQKLRFLITASGFVTALMMMTPLVYASGPDPQDLMGKGLSIISIAATGFAIVSLAIAIVRLVGALANQESPEMQKASHAFVVAILFFAVAGIITALNLAQYFNVNSLTGGGSSGGSSGGSTGGGNT